MRPTSVYIIECSGLLKIGVAAEPASRLKALKTGMPQLPRIAGSREFGSAREAYSVEKRLHRFFHRHRGHGEWFTVTVRDALKALRATEPAPAEHLASPSWTKPTAEEAQATVSEAMNRGKAEALAARKT